MKLLSLEIDNFRGIKHLSLKPGGTNLVIWGPNGSGKSAVVDAIDFVLTGRIPRLTGEGTGGITLTKHGPHIDHRDTPEQATVTATFTIDGLVDPVTLKRSISEPSGLHIMGATAETLKDILDLASRRQHSLSRREILKYVAAEAGTRAEEVQSVLNLSGLEEARRALIKVQNQAKSEDRSAKTAVANAAHAIKTTLTLATFSPEATLTAANKLRAILGAPLLTDVETNSPKAGVSPPTLKEGTATANPTLLKNELDGLLEMLKPDKKDVLDADSKLRIDIESIHADAKATKEYSSLNLLNLGISLLDGSGECPLCGYKWKPEELAEMLNTRAQKATAIGDAMARITEQSQTVATATSNAKLHVDQLCGAAQKLSLAEQHKKLKGWSDSLDKIVKACAEPTKDYLKTGFTASQVATLLATPDLQQDASTVLAHAEKASPATTPEQTAWDTLTTLEANLNQYRTAIADNARAVRFFRRATQLVTAFEETRNKELESLYGSIESRFTELYKCVHEPDEEGFAATLRPDGASLFFEVEFYGRGKHPPQALHSEGHQDSMGLCLYLALAEKLTKNKIGLTVLDDVVMSVDALHRRQVCTLLKKHFHDRQFLITTHDKTWGKQLQTEGVVKRSGYVEFTRWSIETGPSVELDEELWTRIDEDLREHDVPSAAFHLRNGSERFFEMVADDLHAKVRYKLNGRWELGDFMDGAISSFKDYLKKAKASAQSWGKDEDFTRLTELESVVNQVIQRTQFDQWMINASVHYNRWHELSEKDFTPVCDAFRDLFKVFRCTKCGSRIRVAEEKGVETSVRCDCQSINWNLIKKTGE